MSIRWGRDGQGLTGAGCERIRSAESVHKQASGLVGYMHDTKLDGDGIGEKEK